MISGEGRCRHLFKELVGDEDVGRPFAFIDPPFSRNHPKIAAYPSEVTGYFLLQSLCLRLCWPSLSGKRLLDFGCWVRFARTIVNLGLDIAQYVGVETNAEIVSWLSANVQDDRLLFRHLDMRHAVYNRTGASIVDPSTLEQVVPADFDAACMFSVITHQDPADAEAILSMLHPCVAAGGSLYFTALVDEAVERYAEGDPAQPCLLSTYNPDYVIEIVRRSGWEVERTYQPSTFQQAAFVCRK